MDLNYAFLEHFSKADDFIKAHAYKYVKSLSYTHKKMIYKIALLVGKTEKNGN